MHDYACGHVVGVGRLESVGQCGCNGGKSEGPSDGFVVVGWQRSARGVGFGVHWWMGIVPEFVDE